MGLDKLKRWIAVKLIKRELNNLRKEDNVTTVSKVLKFLDGWKLLIGVAILFGSKVFDALNNGHSGDIIGSILSVMGWMPPGGFDMGAVTVAAGSAVALWGFVSKLYKAQQQLKNGASVSGLLSTEGYVTTYIRTGKE